MKVAERVNDFLLKWSGILSLLGLIPTVCGVMSWALNLPWISIVVYWKAYVASLFLAAVVSLWWFIPKTVRSWVKNLLSIEAVGDDCKPGIGDLDEAKKKVPILIIDDQQALVIKKSIQDLGFKNLSTRQDLPSDDSLSAYPILLVDINGIGVKRGSTGLDFALNYKREHPLVQIVMVSAFFSGVSKGDYEQAGRLLDGLFTKGDSYDKKMKGYLENALCRIVNPKHVWLETRKVLLEHGMSLGKLAYFEDQFVKGVKRVYFSNGRRLPYDWVDRIWGGLECELQSSMKVVGVRSFKEKASRDE